ncbi:MAG TPA: TPM domain-containing protein [Verrucomicrobiales bacterium]|nr:TPM domain-containing protein [Verrucomicrobiales bacterium]
MNATEFIHRLDEDRIVAEIAKAEAATSGEIRIFVSSRTVGDPVAGAQRHFEALGMSRTKFRNGVLLYFAPLSRKFAIIGDQGVHEKCGPSFWQELAAEIRPILQSGLFSEAVIRGIQQTGRRLATHFPRDPGDSDELPNAIVGE